MTDLIDSYQIQFDKAIEFLKTELSQLRTGRITSAIIEDIPVLAYGIKQPLKAVATILTQDAKTLLVEPWDKSILQNIDSALRNATFLGVNPVAGSTSIRLPFPELSSERRQELIKVLHQKLENGRIAIRKIREEVREEINELEKGKEISEDDKYDFQESLEKMVKDYNDKIRQIGEEKEKEISNI